MFFPFCPENFAKIRMHAPIAPQIPATTALLFSTPNFICIGIIKAAINIMIGKKVTITGNSDIT